MARPWGHDSLAADLMDCRHKAGEIAMERLAVGGGQLDVAAMRLSWSRPMLTGYEVKISRADFLSDIRSGKWRHYLPYVERLFFAVPLGMVHLREVPDECGLLHRGSRWRAAKLAPVQIVTPERRQAFVQSLLFRHYPAVWQQHSRGLLTLPNGRRVTAAEIRRGETRDLTVIGFPLILRYLRSKAATAEELVDGHRSASASLGRPREYSALHRRPRGPGSGVGPRGHLRQARSHCGCPAPPAAPWITGRCRSVTWIRWDTRPPRAVRKIADELNLSHAEALGLFLSVCCAFAEYRRNGDARWLTDTTLEQWAHWRGRRGRFAAVFRKVALTPFGHIRGWRRLIHGPSRNPIPAAVRAAVFLRDRFRCVCCGATENLQLDHIIAWSDGGGDDEKNLRVLCGDCNLKKGPKPWSAVRRLT